MSGVWAMDATIHDVGGQYIITYDIDHADKNTGYNLGDVNMVCKEACKQLLAKTQAPKERAFIQNEIDHLDAKEKEWRKSYKTW